MRSTVWENSPAGWVAVPLNIRCSRKCASPDLPGVSSAEPTLYQIIWVTTGVRWSGITTTCMPLARVKVVGRAEVTVVWASAAETANGKASANSRQAKRCDDIMTCQLARTQKVRGLGGGLRYGARRRRSAPKPSGGRDHSPYLPWEGLYTLLTRD